MSHYEQFKLLALCTLSVEVPANHHPRIDVESHRVVDKQELVVDSVYFRRFTGLNLYYLQKFPFEKLLLWTRGLPGLVLLERLFLCYEKDIIIS